MNLIILKHVYSSVSTDLALNQLAVHDGEKIEQNKHHTPVNEDNPCLKIFCNTDGDKVKYEQRSYTVCKQHYTQHSTGHSVHVTDQLTQLIMSMSIQSPPRLEDIGMFQHLSFYVFIKSSGG